MASETPRTSCAARRVATMTRHLTRAPVAASPSPSSSGGFAVAILGAILAFLVCGRKAAVAAPATTTPAEEEMQAAVKKLPPA